MAFQIGQQIVYPNHGVGTIENIERKQIGANSLSFYALCLSFNNTTVLIPIENADEIGLRLPVAVPECDLIIHRLAERCEDIPPDWKTRSKIYAEVIQRGQLREIADVYKKLTYLSRLKPLSFREQRLLEKAHYLVISELTAVCRDCDDIETRVYQALNAACAAMGAPAFKTAVH